MRKIKEVLRLKWGKGMSNRKIAASCGSGRPTVGEYLRQNKKNKRDTHQSKIIIGATKRSGCAVCRVCHRGQVSPALIAVRTFRRKRS